MRLNASALGFDAYRRGAEANKESTVAGWQQGSCQKHNFWAVFWGLVFFFSSAVPGFLGRNAKKWMQLPYLMHAWALIPCSS